MKATILAFGLFIGLAAMLPLGIGDTAERQSMPIPAVTVTVTSRNAGAAPFPIAARVGDQFTITLDSNHTTGYQWQLAASPDVKIVQFVLNVYNEPSKPIPGRGGSETWTFKAAGKGKTAIAFKYVRPWEKNVAPIRTQKFDVEVR